MIQGDGVQEIIVHKDSPWRPELKDGSVVWVDNKCRTVLAHGCFDLLHLGHIRHLQEARKLGDRLVVSVTPDQFVAKGNGRPVFSAEERVEALKALDCVDEVFVNDGEDATAAISRVKPAVYVKGGDYEKSYDDPALAKEITAVIAHGGRFHVTKAQRWSSSRIINGRRLPDDVLSYLQTARDRQFLSRIKLAFEKADKLKIAFVGETIIDEYCYVEALGRSSKEYMLATVEKRSEQFLGGICAASIQGEWPNADVVTVSDPIRKKRFVDADFARKLFEVYSSKTIELTEPKRGIFHTKLIEATRDSDVVVVIDFGHGLFGPHERHICESAKFLAVNAQTNAGNHGFNLVSKYRKADYICVDEPEAKLAAGIENYDSTTELVDGINKHVLCGKYAITHGRFGAGTVDRSSGEHDRTAQVPALSVHGVDTIGAGDAFLAVSAPLIAAGLELEAAAFVGNVAGAIKIGIVGHSRHVERKELIETVEALLK